MTRIKKDELYRHLSSFLKSKGIGLQSGAYSKRIRQGCTILSDTINFSQNTLEKARKGVDKNFERMRSALKKPASKPVRPPAKTSNTKAKAEATRVVVQAKTKKTKRAKAKRAPRR